MGSPAESDLGFWPGPGLMPGLVSSTVGYREVGPPQVLHRGLPSPYLTFLFSLADPIVTGTSPEQARGPDASRTSVIVGGLHSQPAYIVPDAHQEGVQLAVHPLAARAVFGVPCAELTALVTEGADVLGPGAEKLRSQLVELPTWPARFATLQRFLRGRVSRGQRPAPPRPEVVRAWRWIADRRGATSLAGLATHVALSPRQLGSLFIREVGMSPKQVAGLMRFDHAAQLVGRAPVHLDLSTIALRAGYYDHADLGRAFTRYAGISPTGWRAEERRNLQAGGHRNGEDWVHE